MLRSVEWPFGSITSLSEKWSFCVTLHRSLHAPSGHLVSNEHQVKCLKAEVSSLVSTHQPGGILHWGVFVNLCDPLSWVSHMCREKWSYFISIKKANNPLSCDCPVKEMYVCTSQKASFVCIDLISPSFHSIGKYNWIKRLYCHNRVKVRNFIFLVGSVPCLKKVETCCLDNAGSLGESSQGNCISCREGGRKRKRQPADSTRAHSTRRGSDGGVTHQRGWGQGDVAYGGFQLIHRRRSNDLVSWKRLDLDFELFPVVLLFFRLVRRKEGRLPGGLQ